MARENLKGIFKRAEYFGCAIQGVQQIMVIEHLTPILQGKERQQAHPRIQASHSHKMAQDSTDQSATSVL